LYKATADGIIGMAIDTIRTADGPAGKETRLTALESRH